MAKHIKINKLSAPKTNQPSFELGEPLNINRLTELYLEVLNDLKDIDQDNKAILQMLNLLLESQNK